jgi:hypothetical protein
MSYAFHFKNWALILVGFSVQTSAGWSQNSYMSQNPDEISEEAQRLEEAPAWALMSEQSAPKEGEKLM